MKKIDYLSELLKVDAHRERALLCLEEFMHHQQEAMKKIEKLQTEFQQWQKETENSTQ